MHKANRSSSVRLSTLLFTSLALTVACGGSSVPSGADASTPVTDGGATPDAAVAGADLDGTWQGPCWMDARTTLVYDHLALTGTYTEYEMGSACAAGRERHRATWTGHATIGAEVSPGVHQLDLAFDSFHSTALTDAEAAYVNMGMYCGFSDWAAGVEKDILGHDCYGFSIPVGGRSLDLYRVDGDMLLLGAGAMISASPSESDRPTELDPTRPFTRD